MLMTCHPSFFASSYSASVNSPDPLRQAALALVRTHIHVPASSCKTSRPKPRARLPPVVYSSIWLRRMA